MSILRSPSAPFNTVMGHVPTTAHARFKGAMLPALWAAAVGLGVDPVGVIAQSGKETAWGTYPGQVKPEFYNTCGLKVRHMNLFPGVTDGDRPLAHSMFANWAVGALAHVQHLCAYAGQRDLSGLIVDPRFTLVTGAVAVTWADLGGRWAPSKTYGVEITNMMRRLQGVP